MKRRFGRAGAAPAQETLERREQPLRREHQLRGVDHVGRQFDRRGEALRRRVERLRIGAPREQAVEIVEPLAAEAPGERGTRQCEQVADRGETERVQRAGGRVVPSEQREGQRGEGAFEPGRLEQVRAGQPPCAGQRDDARGARRHRIAERRAIAECVQSIAHRAAEPRTPAEQPLAGAGFEQHAVGLHDDLARELVGPRGEFAERIALAFGIAFDGDQVAHQRLRRRELHSRRRSLAARDVVAVDDERSLRLGLRRSRSRGRARSRARPVAAAAKARRMASHNIGSRSLQAGMVVPDALAHLVEQTRRAQRRGGVPGGELRGE